VRKSKSQFEFEDGIYDLEWASSKPGMVLGSTMNFLWQGSGGGLTPVPLGVETYLAEYRKDREEVRNTPIYDPDTEEVRLMPSLDYKIAHRLIRREHTEGWYGQAKYNRLMKLLYLLLIGLVVLSAGMVYVGVTPHIETDCFDPHNTANFTQWTPLVCPSQQHVTTTTTTSKSTFIPGQVP